MMDTPHEFTLKQTEFLHQFIKIELVLIFYQFFMEDEKLVVLLIYELLFLYNLYQNM